MLDRLQNSQPIKKIKKRIKARRLKSRLKELELFTEIIPDGVIIINQNLHDDLQHVALAKGKRPIFSGGMSDH